jgi:hypothetical protein
MPTNITTDKEGSKATLIKTRGHKKLRIAAILPVLADRQQLTPSVILGEGKNNLVKQKLPTGMICNVM